MWQVFQRTEMLEEGRFRNLGRLTELYGRFEGGGFCRYPFHVGSEYVICCPRLFFFVRFSLPFPYQDISTKIRAVRS